MDETERTNDNEHKILNKLPFEIVDVNEECLKNSCDPKGKYVHVGPKRYFLWEGYRAVGLQLYNFEARPDDVYLIGFPRSGTTLHAEMTWLIGNDLNYEGANKEFLHNRFPHADLCLFDNTVFRPSARSDSISKGNNITEENIFSKCTSEGNARYLQFHLPVSLISPHVFEVGAKIIYCARNPKDIIVSCYNLTRFFKMRNSLDFKAYFGAFKSDLRWWCPYFEHVKEAWARRNEKNFLFIFYEDTIKDKQQTILKVGNLLGKELTKDQLKILEEHLDIENFRKNKRVNLDFLVESGDADGNYPFIGKGKPGTWREHFDVDLQKEADEWIEENLKDTDLRFPDC